MDTIYSLLIVFVLYYIVSDWFMHEYGERLNGDNFYKFKIGSFFSYQIKALKPLKRLVNLNDDNLAKQPIFWIGTILPLIVSGWIEYHVILLNPELLSFGSVGDLFTKSAPALYISALTPTLGIIISNIHRTIQTKNQIEIAENQFNVVRTKNNQDLFYSHNKYVTERIDSIDIKKKVNTKEISSFFSNFYNDSTSFHINTLRNNTIKISVKDKNKLYRKIFSIKNKESTFGVGISYEFIDNLEKITDELASVLNTFDLHSKLCFYGDDNLSILLISNENNFSLKSFFRDLIRALEGFEDDLELNLIYNESQVEKFLDNKSFIERYINNEFFLIEIENNYIRNAIDVKYKNEVFEFMLLYKMFHTLIVSISKIIDDIYHLVLTDSVYDSNEDYQLESILASDTYNWFDSKFMNFSYEFYDLDSTDAIE
ncbi:hypothetical protein ACT2XF_001442 [Providencia rettgeri]